MSKSGRPIDAIGQGAGAAATSAAPASATVAADQSSSSPSCLGCDGYHGGVVVHIKCLEKTIREQRETIREMLAEIAERNRNRR